MGPRADTRGPIRWVLDCMCMGPIIGSIMKIPVIVSNYMLKKAKAKVAIGLIWAEQLYERFEVPNRDPVTKKGYQRPPQPSRVNRLVEDLDRNLVDLPTALLLNLRGEDAERRLIKDQSGQTYLRLKDHDRLQVVDGQHRVLALQKLLHDSPERWRDLQVPFVLMLGANEWDEMTEFHIVNSTAKSVPTDLANDLLKQRAEREGGLIDVLEGRGQSWKVRAQQLVEELGRRSSLWRQRIRMAAEPKADTTIGSTGVLNSLRPVLNIPFFQQLRREDQFAVLEAFWNGISRVLPEAFEDPDVYSLQKSVGVMAMHELFPAVLEQLRTRSLPITSAESYEEVLRSPLKELEGENAHGHPVGGIDFWRVGEDGAAGAFTSNAGRRVLVAKIRNALPPLNVSSR